MHKRVQEAEEQAKKLKVTYNKEKKRREQLEKEVEHYKALRKEFNTYLESVIEEWDLNNFIQLSVGI